MTTTPNLTPGEVPDDEPRYLRLVPGGLTEPGTDVQPAEHGEPAVPDGDAETVVEGEVVDGVPVDAADVPITTTWQSLTTRPRVPIIPAWLRDQHEFRSRVRVARDLAGYTIGFYLTRSPKYAVKTLWYAPKGARRVVGTVIRWAAAEEGNFALRQHAANTNDAHTWQALDRTRAKSSKARWWLVIPATIALMVTVLGLHATGAVPAIGWWAALVGLLIGLARLGRPIDSPILDHVSNGPKFVKLTAEMVRSAFSNLGMSRMKDPASISFKHPGIHRDGPGWLARIDLPEGMEAVKVLEKRDALSSALRLPIDQVWPTAGPDHAGQVDLWVGYKPASKMGTPRWPLTDENARTSYFELTEFGYDQRLRPIKAQGFGMNYLIGGRPGSGKSFAGRSLVTTFLLDPTVELKIAEYKGTGDFLDMEPLCSTYVCGLSDEDMAAGLGMLNWGLAEAERRGKRIKEAYLRGEAPERKVTPELAAKPGSGLHPVVIVIDEAHELFGDSTVGKEAGLAAERLAKRGRALAITLIVITQIPDKDSLPTGITRNIGIRWCLAVPDQVANDMILGTGAYKRGITGTIYRPGIDAGWGVLTGLAEPTSVRNHFPAPKEAAALIARAGVLRHGRKVGAGIDAPAARDLLADLLEVAAANGQHWEKAAPALAERWPEAYPALTQDALSELARAQGVESVDVKVAGRNRKGYKTPVLRGLIAARDSATDPAAKPDGDANPDDETSTQS
ncbi:FtsK/SpoIIIE domain-containing protein [Actinoplanes sp. CA-030573]|uniref:FtsK/SpoIIIE domain-containing protein n=1 Tax=Actinoplanes sp. CA-030573 TaxID=3239898 RepID=UPI003D8DC288